MGRKRLTCNRGLEPNLYYENGIYKYRNPITGKKKSIGSQKAPAQNAARIANARLVSGADLVGIIMGTANKTVKEITADYINEVLPERRWAAQTLKNNTYILDNFVKQFGKLPIRNIDVMQLSQWLDAMGNKNAYIKNRTRLVDLWKFAISKGYADDNVAEKTLVKSYSVEDRKRQRLTIEDYQKIYGAAPEWLQIAMGLALITLQRRGDVASLRYDDIRKDGRGIERLYVIQDKTKRKSDKAFIAIRMSDSLRALVSRSRADGIASPFIVHSRPLKRDREQIKAKIHWTQVTPDHITKTFRHIRDDVLKLYPKLPATERPSFHEIRSLGIYLYKNKLKLGNTYTQDLAGHADKKMTEAYAQGHEVEYNEVNAEMDFGSMLQTTLPL